MDRPCCAQRRTLFLESFYLKHFSRLNFVFCSKYYVRSTCIQWRTWKCLVGMPVPAFDGTTTDNDWCTGRKYTSYVRAPCVGWKTSGGPYKTPFTLQFRQEGRNADVKKEGHGSL